MFEGLTSTDIYLLTSDTAAAYERAYQDQEAAEDLHNQDPELHHHIGTHYIDAARTYAHIADHDNAKECSEHAIAQLSLTTEEDTPALLTEAYALAAQAAFHLSEYRTTIQYLNAYLALHAAGAAEDDYATEESRLAALLTIVRCYNKLDEQHTAIGICTSLEGKITEDLPELLTIFNLELASAHLNNYSTYQDFDLIKFHAEYARELALKTGNEEQQEQAELLLEEVEDYLD